MWLLQEVKYQIIVLLQYLLELMSQVDEEVRVERSTLKVLTVILNVVTSKVLVIEENDHLIVRLTDNCSPQSEWNILSLSRVDVENTITDSIVVYLLV